MKVIITGGHEYTFFDYHDLVWLDQLQQQYPIWHEVVTGGARGANTQAVIWARSRDIKTHVIFVDGKKVDGKSPESKRNTEMLDYAGKDALVVLFPGGTADMRKQAKQRKLKVIERKRNEKTTRHMHNALALHHRDSKRQAIDPD